MNWLNRVSLAAKLAASLLVVLVLFLFLSIALLVSSTQSFTEEVGDESIQNAVNVVRSAFLEEQSHIKTDISFLTSDVGFFQAVGRRDTAALTAIIERVELSDGVYDIHIVDGDGNLLLDTHLHENEHEIGEAAGDFLADLTDEIGPIQVFIEEHEEGIEIAISGAARVVSATGNVLGGIRMAREIDNEFLELLVSGQTNVTVGLVYGGEFVAMNGESEAGGPTLAALGLDQMILNRSVRGGMVIAQEVITTNNVPYLVAYLDISSQGSSSPVGLMLLVNLSELYNFSTRLQISTIGAFLVLIVITLILISVALYRSVLEPIDRLSALAQDMTIGQYTKRIPITSQDELGQLSDTFNQMADAIQQREVSLQAARERAEAADQVKSAFLASMSHELRTPLNAIINFTKFVAKGDLGPVNGEQEETLYEVVDSGKHLLNLINDVLDMSKIEAGSLTLFVTDDVNLDQVLYHAISTGKSLLNGKSVEIQADVADDLPHIRGDRQRLVQIMLNIMSNACKFTEEGVITLSACHREGEVVISVSDTGPGIAPEDHDLVFQAFKQTESGVRQGGGTGLGMPITKSLVEAHGGQLRLESRMGEGATFTVTLPISSNVLLPTLA